VTEFGSIKLVNLTGHDVTLIRANETEVVGADGFLRVFSDSTTVGSISYGRVEIPLIDIREQEVEVPAELERTLYIVSGIVAAKAKRADFVTPARVVRESGRIVGCRALARIIT